jgi:hypothetical protein
MKTRLYFSIFAFVFIAAPLAKAQDISIQHNPYAWYKIAQTINLDPKWSIGVDGEFRVIDILRLRKHFESRQILNYKASKMLTLSIGHTNILVKNTAGWDVPETQLFERATVKKAFKKFTWTNRFQIEHRKVGSGASGSIKYGEKLRWQTGVTIPMKNQPKLAWLISDEYHIRHYHDTPWESLFDQNRFFVGVGYKWQKHLGIETGYLNQYSKTTTSKTMNHVFVLTLTDNFDL